VAEVVRYYKAAAAIRNNTDLLQTDAVSLSDIFSSILDLECHLQQHPTDQQLVTSMLRGMRSRFLASATRL